MRADEANKGVLRSYTETYNHFAYKKFTGTCVYDRLCSYIFFLVWIQCSL